MGIFLTIGLETQHTGSEEKNKLALKVLKYVTYNLRVDEWQESLSGQVRKLEGHHITLRIVLRFFRQKNIQEGNLKSLFRYKKKDDKLVIDQMIIIDDYIGLPEDEMRVKMCDEIFEYAEGILIKYKDRFQDFDAITFIPLFKERIEKIKANELVLVESNW